MDNQQLTPIKRAFENDDVKKRFFDMLGTKAPGFIVSVINVTSNNKLLAKADRDSILFAAAAAASLDLPIDPNLGFAAIVPYGNKAQFQIMVKGFKQLALRSAQFEALNETEIYEGQLIEENPLMGYKFDFSKKTSDKIIGYASYFKLLNGFEKTFYMTVEQIEAHAMRYSKAYQRDKREKKQDSNWTTDFHSMALKTVIKQNLSKNAPLSIEMQKAVLVDQGIINDWDGNPNYDDNDDRKPDVEDVAAQKEAERVKKHIADATSIEILEQAFEYVEDLSMDNEIKTAYIDKHKELSEKENK